MNRGIEQGYAQGIMSGVKSGLGTGMQSFGGMTNGSYMLNPRSITDPKTKPVYYINGENVSLTSGSIQNVYNVVDDTGGQFWPKVETIFDQTAGTTYRPPLIRGALGGRNVMNFADTGNRYLASTVTATSYFYASTSPSVTATGMTWMFVVKRKDNAGQYSIFDGRDSTTLATAGDLLLEVNAAGAITFTYCGGIGGSATNLIGTAGVNLLNDWSILTVKAQLRKDGLAIPDDSSGSTIAKRFMMPIGNRQGTGSQIDIFVNGVEQRKTITTDTWTNSDYYNDGTYRMLNRQVFIGNKGAVYGTSGTYIAASVMFPCYISKGLQQRVENYFRFYYSQPF